MIIGKLKSDPNGSTKSQSLRFDKKYFTLTQAKKWLKDHQEIKKGVNMEIVNRDIYNYLGLDEKEDNGTVMEWKSSVTLSKSTTNEDEQSIIGTASNSSKDLHNEAMHPKFVKKMAKQINKVIRKKKFFPQFSNHDFAWENMIGKIYRAWEDNGNLKYLSYPIKANPQSKQLIEMIQEDAPIENSIVICRVEFKEMEHPETKEKMDMIINGVIKSIDFVGLGANEETNVGIAKSFNKNINLIRNIGRETMELDINNKDSRQGESEDRDSQDQPDISKTVKELEDWKKSFSENTVKNLKEAAETALKDSIKQMKEDFKKEYETLVEEHVKKLLNDRTQKALRETGITKEEREKELKEKMISLIEQTTNENELNNILSNSLEVLNEKGAFDKK